MPSKSPLTLSNLKNISQDCFSALVRHLGVLRTLNINLKLLNRWWENWVDTIMPVKTHLQMVCIDLFMKRSIKKMGSKIPAKFLLSNISMPEFIGLVLTWHDALNHRWQTQAPLAESGLAPCFYQAAVPSSLPLVKE